MNKLRVLFGIAVLGFLVATQVLTADVYIKQKRHTGEMNFMGQNKPAEDVEEEIWMTDKGVRTDSDKTSAIMLFDEKKLYMIDHEKKTYMEMPMDFEKLSSEMMKDQNEEDVKKMQGMMQNMMKIEASVEVTDEKQKINDWNCKKYILTMNMMMGTITQEIWATEEIKIDESLYSKYATSAYSAMPGMQAALGSLLEEMKKIKGVHVKTITSQKVMNQNFESWTELITFKETSAPDDIFQLPSGYKKTAMR